MERITDPFVNMHLTGYGQPSGSNGRTFSNSRGRRDSRQQQQPVVVFQQPKQKGRRNQRSNQRMEKFRHEKSTYNDNLYQEELKKQLFVGTSSVDDALIRLGETQQLKAITLSITTRGIGMGICQTMFTAISINENIVPPSCYSLYRIFLATFEAKMESLKQDYPLVSRDSALTYSYDVSSRLQHLAKTVTVAPTPIVKIINAVGIVKRDGLVYIPAVMGKTVNRNDQYVPRPENVMYSSLRDTVVALANPQTPEQTRIYFENHNPIPGAIFENHLLQNADEIMPANYNYDDLQREIRLIQPFLIKLQKHVPKLVAGNVDFKSIGKNSLFISNELENLRIPTRARNQDLQDWYQSCLPLGNIHTYYARWDLPAADRFEGQINLLGEYPDKANIRWPFYSNRDSNVCPLEISSDYHGIHQIMYGT